MSGVKGRGARDPLPEIIKIWVLKGGTSNSATMNHVFNDSMNAIEWCASHFDINGPSNLTEMEPAIST